MWYIVYYFLLLHVISKKLVLKYGNSVNVFCIEKWWHIIMQCYEFYYYSLKESSLQKMAKNFNINVKGKLGKVKWQKNRLKRGEEYDTYLIYVCRQSQSVERSEWKHRKQELSVNTVPFIKLTDHFPLWRFEYNSLTVQNYLYEQHKEWISTFNYTSKWSVPKSERMKLGDWFENNGTINASLACIFVKQVTCLWALFN